MAAATGLRRPRELVHSLALLGALSALWALPLATLAAAPVATAPKPAVCLIEPDSVAEVGSQVVGLVERLHVERGESVRAGQALVSLRADVERANAHVADTRAGIDADVRAAAASLDLAQQKFKRAQALVKESFVSDQALEQARSERELAAQRLAQARGQQQIYQQERRVADAQLGLRSVKSPLSGVVVERYVNVGERVEERPLLRVAVIDPLRVELMVPTALYGSIQRGGQLTIRPELPGQAPVTATVRQVDKVMDAASNTFRVRLSLPNPNNRMPAGLRCKVDLPGMTQASAAELRPTPKAVPGTAQDAAAPRTGTSSTSGARSGFSLFNRASAQSNTPAPRASLRMALALD
ncbi:RND family efflux transporter, MFP subunit [Burkholderiales bacterium JOSHI_001]|nr:RND family efflux transporter, MFP subunit [Burkholderiales bacterium JOSHI_001]